MAASAKAHAPLAVRDRIAALTEDFARDWRMQDPRYRQTQPDAPYASYLLSLAPDERLSIVLDIFMPGQRAAIHNHRSWGALVCLEGLCCTKSLMGFILRIQRGSWSR